MKYLICLLLALAVSIPALAENTPAQKRANIMAYCEQASLVARAAAEGNQVGTPLATHLEIFRSYTLSEPILGRYMEHVIIEAYNRPRYSLASYQENEIAEYRDQVHASCLTLLL